MYSLFNIYPSSQIFVDNFYDFKYKTKSGIYFLSSEISEKIGLLSSKIYEYGLLTVIQNKYGFYLEYHPDFNNKEYHIVNKVAYWGSHNWYELYNDEELKTMKMDTIPWFFSTLFE